MSLLDDPINDPIKMHGEKAALPIIRYCLPLIPESVPNSYSAESIKSALRQLSWHRQLSLERLSTQADDRYYDERYYEEEPHYSCCEIWLDYQTDNQQLKLTESLLQHYPNRILFILRRLQLAPSQITQARRQEILKLINDHNGWVDLDVSTQLDDLKFIQQHCPNIQLVASYHNYQATPDVNGLERLTQQMQIFNPKVYKFATYCNNKNDALRLCELQETLLQKNQDNIVLGMGRHGLVTRILGCWWGNYLCFAPLVLGQASAPGQLALPQLHRLFRELSYTYEP